MDFPIFHADFFGNRLLIAIIGILHILINHPFAVGMMPLITVLEWWAYRRNRADWDELLRKILGVCFIVTTTVGALTGVGIWFSTAVVNPYAIGSLLRVFYWAWFTEWVIFCSEVVLILFYFLTWKRMGGERKPAHIRIGIALSIMSWLTMVIVTGILGFMMNPGGWAQEQSLLSGFLNPLYHPQLLLRTTLALGAAGSLALALALPFTEKGSKLRSEATRIFCGWTLFWVVPMIIWSAVYYRAIPVEMLVNLPVAFGTQAWAGYYGLLLKVAAGITALLIGLCLWGLWQPKRTNAAVWILPIICFAILMGQFERTRQFIRKPYVIGFYMFSNGIRVSDVPYILKTGVLANSLWTRHTTVTPENKVEAGRDVFMIACSRCHTLNGMNSVSSNLARLYPGQAWWNAGAIDTYIKNIHGARPHMPPFAGTAAERSALAAYLATLYDRRDLTSTADLPTNNRK